MADTFFGFDTTLGENNLEDGLECPLEEDELEEEEYDALNDETFGPDAAIGDWEEDHEKLAEITESNRLHNQSATNKKSISNINIEDNLSHLVLDKEGIVPRPGVWGSPLNLSLPKAQPRLSLPNACTVEELERGLIANRPPPGLSKPQTQQQQKKSEGSLLFEALSLNEKLQVNGLPPPRFPPGLGLPGAHPIVVPNIRAPHPQLMQHPRILGLINQAGTVLRYPSPPHLMSHLMPQPVPRQPLHGSYGFPPQLHPNLGGPQFLRPDHMMPAFPNNQTNHQQHQHSYSHLGNQRNQNRSYYHNEQQAGHQAFFKNNQYPHRNHDRNNQRPYHHQNYSHNINGNASGEYEHSGKLAIKAHEKQWLINIQLLQLNTIQPYVDDHYYVVFCDKRNKQHANREQKDKKHHNNNGYHRDHRDWEPTPQTASRSAYTPAQFENSLGKLHCSSVTAPRKLIDMDVVSNNDSQSTPQSQQKDTKKTRQLLLEIERLFTLQFKLEDLSNPLALIPEPQQQQEGESDVNTTKTESELINMILTCMQQLIQDDKLASMLSIRKGKTLLLRFLPHLNVTEYSKQLRELWTAIFKGLAVIGRRDCHILTDFYSEFRRWLDAVKDFDTILRLARALSDSATNHPVKNNSLTFALLNKFGVSAIAAMLEQVEQLCDTDDSLPSEWSTFVVTIVELIGDSPPCVAPCQPITTNTLKKHLNRISSLKLERYTALACLLTDANPLR
ncbi:Protein PAT1 like protein 1 [Atta colombica]|uniref:Protein PAT1 like protein 1 n=1 Tax=Atta colombica TaxID=520822 RepID=A0A195BRF1_9HYME|nr:PREDICTED: protein PAT1 homolog 1 [Atta colombica]KYM88534.1 Protein PAT1 like protein 1 [Atta colombica]